MYSMVITGIRGGALALVPGKGWASPLTAPTSCCWAWVRWTTRDRALGGVTGGLAALIACVAVGPRVSRYNRKIDGRCPCSHSVFQTPEPYLCGSGRVRIQQRGDDDAFCGATVLAAKSVARRPPRVLQRVGRRSCSWTTQMPNQKDGAAGRRHNGGAVRVFMSISGCAGMIDVWVSIIIGFVAGLVYVGPPRCSSPQGGRCGGRAVAPIHLFGGIRGTPRRHLHYQEFYLLMAPGSPNEMAAEGKEYKAPAGCSRELREPTGSQPALAARTVLWVSLICSLDNMGHPSFMHTLRVNLNDEMKGIDVVQYGRSYTEFQTTVFTFKMRDGAQHSMEMRVRAGDAGRSLRWLLAR